jgi:hypothetical protein
MRRLLQIGVLSGAVLAAGATGAAACSPYDSAGYAAPARVAGYGYIAAPYDDEDVYVERDVYGYGYGPSVGVEIDDDY